MNKLINNQTLKIALGIIIGITGVLTVIFSILNLAKVESVNPSTVLQFLIGVILVVIGTSVSVLAIFSESPAKPVAFISAAIVLGLGISLFIQEGVVYSIVGLVFPIVVACFGTLTFILSIVQGIKKTNNKFVLNMILSAGLIAAGVCFAVFNKNKTLQAIIWLLIGFTIIALSIIYIVFTIKGRSFKAKISNSNKSEDIH